MTYRNNHSDGLGIPGHSPSRASRRESAVTGLAPWGGLRPRGQAERYLERWASWKMMDWKSVGMIFHSQYDGKIIKVMFHTTNQIIYPRVNKHNEPAMSRDWKKLASTGNGWFDGRTVQLPEGSNELNIELQEKCVWKLLMFRLDSDGCRWVFSSLDPAEFCPTRRLSLVPFNLGANTPPLSAKSSAVGGRQLCTFESQEKRVCITYTKLTKHPHCWWLNCYYWQEPSATRMWFQFARCRSVLPKMADEIHALNLPSSLRITDILTWVWVKIRYPNNWMVNTKLD